MKIEFLTENFMRARLTKGRRTTMEAFVIQHWSYEYGHYWKYDNGDHVGLLVNWALNRAQRREELKLKKKSWRQVISLPEAKTLK